MRSLLVFLLLAFVADAGEPVRLVVLHTNDLHGQLRPHPPSPVRAVLRGKPAGGFAHLASMVEAARREGHATLLLDAGDLFQGTPIGNETRGDAVIDAMNLLRYDATAVGNHEFDYGIPNLLRLARRSRFPWLAANMAANDDLRPILPYVVLAPPRTPCRIAIIGLITTKTPAMTTPNLGGKVRFSDPVRVVHSLLRNIDADLHFVVSHLGVQDDERLARATPGLDLIIGGHNHLPIGKVVSGVRIAQTHGKGLSLGRVDLDLLRKGDRWSVARSEAKLLPVDPAATPAHDGVQALIAKYAKVLDRKMAVVVGTLTKPARRKRGLESSSAGNWMADVLRAVGKAEIGITNKGGIRTDLEAGEITTGDIYRLMPFDNTVVSMDLTGAEVLALVRKHVANDGYPSLDFSGMTVEVGDKVTVRVGEAPLSAGQTYRVATNSFLSRGGDGFMTFRDGRHRRSTGVLFRDALAADLRARTPLTPPETQRFLVVATRR